MEDRGESPDDIIVPDKGEIPSDQPLEDGSHDTEEESRNVTTGSQTNDCSTLIN